MLWDFIIRRTLGSRLPTITNSFHHHHHCHSFWSHTHKHALSGMAGSGKSTLMHRLVVRTWDLLGMKFLGVSWKSWFAHKNQARLQGTMKGPWVEVARWINQGTSGDGFRFRKVFWNREPFQEASKVPKWPCFRNLKPWWNREMIFTNHYPSFWDLPTHFQTSKVWAHRRKFTPWTWILQCEIWPIQWHLDSYRWLMTGMWNWGRW